MVWFIFESDVARPPYSRLIYSEQGIFLLHATRRQMTPEGHYHPEKSCCKGFYFAIVRHGSPQCFDGSAN